MRSRFLPCLAALALVAGSLPLRSAPLVAVYDLEGQLSESGQAGGSLLDFSFVSEPPLTHFDLARSLEAAAVDEDLQGVVLEIDQAGFSFAQVQELLRLLEAIRESGKDIWIYSESLGRGSALFGSVANHFVLMPEADVDLTGLFGETLYYKGLFDKLGIQADVVHIGDYKSAGESFSRTGPSEASVQQMESLMDATFSQTMDRIAAGRGIEPVALRKFVDQGLQTPQQAVAAGLVDDLQYRTDFIRIVREHYGEGARFDRNYQLPNRSGPELDSMFDVFNLLFSSGRKRGARHDYLAVVALEGAITNDSIAPVRKEVLDASRDAKCRGLILRVNSPGGSALASEVLWEATEEFQATGKPFAVSMGGVAASGGYYVSAGAPRIFAEEGTITGSIGVVGMKIALGGGMEKLGITSHETKRGRHADLMNTTRPFTDEERTLVRKSMLDVYQTFKQRILDGRGDRLQGDLDQLAGGRVYVGARALELGLVDAIGGLTDAVAWVGDQTGLDHYDVHLRPEPQDFLSGLFAPPPAPDPDGEFIRHTPRPNPAAATRAYLETQPLLRLLDPAKQAALAGLLDQLEAFQDERILLLAPHFTNLSLRN